MTKHTDPLVKETGRLKVRYVFDQAFVDAVRSRVLRAIATLRPYI